MDGCVTKTHWSPGIGRVVSGLSNITGECDREKYSGGPAAQLPVLQDLPKITLTFARNRPELAMMFRVLLSIVLIANLLACPLRCASCAAGMSTVGECAQAACSCCPHRNQLPTERPGDSPHGSCPCPDCICEGATLEDSPTVEASTVEGARFDAWPSSLEPDFAITLTRNQTCHSAHFLSRQRSRDALIARQTWLVSQSPAQRLA
ncbi:hypothetical protein Fuma_02347 [Fuerstiella marisgermanici]|uniref:Uncharacterized protein n=1 Tax=Fuerstiella marisgermanici TaxID=1891926 RepID=A0A1P8WF93_9PLAN|nr:hypothetical protein Fuma_02347 [Fuerstiella marisgermanici]